MKLSVGLWMSGLLFVLVALGVELYPPSYVEVLAFIGFMLIIIGLGLEER